MKPAPPVTRILISSSFGVALKARGAPFFPIFSSFPMKRSIAERAAEGVLPGGQPHSEHLGSAIAIERGERRTRGWHRVRRRGHRIDAGGRVLAPPRIEGQGGHRQVVAATRAV